MTSLRRVVCLLAVVAGFVPVVFGLSLARYIHAPLDLPAPVSLEVEQGASAGAVATELARAGLGGWRLGTYWGMRLWGEPSRLKAGTYSFEGEVRLVDVFADLAAGRVALVSVTFPEGYTAREMAPVLAKAGVTDADGFLALAYSSTSAKRWGVPGPTLEGYLFPDTYRFARALPPEEVVTTMVERFKGVARELSPRLNAGELGLGQWVALASVIEKETGAGSERPLVASVFMNRLERNMRLESDPTVIYGIKDFDGNIRKADLRRDTPYNTYTRRGIPPGPIASPGRDSLAAVLEPATTEYLYFVSRGDGTHVFSRTYDEHLAAVRRFQLRRK